MDTIDTMNKESLDEISEKESLFEFIVDDQLLSFISWQRKNNPLTGYTAITSKLEHYADLTRYSY